MLVAPYVLTQPANQTVIAGTTATFTVAAGGTPPLSFQWYQKTRLSPVPRMPAIRSRNTTEQRGQLRCDRVEQLWLSDEHGGDVDGVDTASDYATADEPGGDARQQRQLQR